MNELWVGYARVALAACRDGDTLVVTKLDRLARSLPDTCGILDELTRRNVKLSLGGSIHDPTDPVGRLLFNVLAMVAEFESDVIRLRMREGMKVAKAKGWLRGKQPKAVAEPGETPAGAARLRELHRSRARRTVSLGRSTIYRTIDRMRPKPVEPERPSAQVLPRFETTEISTPPFAAKGGPGRKRAANGQQAALHVSDLPLRHMT